MIEAPLLALVNFSKPSFTSNFSKLQQERHPLSCFSEKVASNCKILWLNYESSTQSLQLFKKETLFIRQQIYNWDWSKESKRTHKRSGSDSKSALLPTKLSGYDYVISDKPRMVNRASDSLCRADFTNQSHLMKQLLTENNIPLIYRRYTKKW